MIHVYKNKYIMMKSSSFVATKKNKNDFNEHGASIV
jgi:hypothetical protein